MELTVSRIDVAACLARPQGGKLIHDVVTRDHPSERWYVPFSPLSFDRVSDWRFYEQGHQIVIPLYPYRTADNPMDAIGFAFQMGVNALHQLGGKPVKRLHLALGEPLQQVQDSVTGTSQLLLYFGIGVVFQ